MKLRPLGWRVYLKLEDGEDGTEVPTKLKELEFQIRRGMDENAIKRNLSSDDVGVVVALGPLAYMRQDLQGNRSPEQWEPWCKVGDRVVFGRHSGKLVKDTDSGDWLYLCNDEDIQSVIESENFEALGSSVEQEIEQYQIHNIEE